MGELATLIRGVGLQGRQSEWQLIVALDSDVCLRTNKIWAFILPYNFVHLPAFLLPALLGWHSLRVPQRGDLLLSGGLGTQLCLCCAAAHSHHLPVLLAGVPGQPLAFVSVQLGELIIPPFHDSHLLLLQPLILSKNATSYQKPSLQPPFWCSKPLTFPISIVNTQMHITF